MDPERAPDLRDLLFAVDAGWRSQAACRDEPDDRLFLSDKALHSQPGSPTILRALLICAGCPVRRECLLEAMTPIVSHPPRWDSRSERMQTGVGSSRIMLSGVWGGTLEAERSPLWNVPIPEAVDQLERTFPVRLAGFAQAFAGSRGQRRAKSEERPTSPRQGPARKARGRNTPSRYTSPLSGLLPAAAHSSPFRRPVLWGPVPSGRPPCSSDPGAQRPSRGRPKGLRRPMRPVRPRRIQTERRGFRAPERRRRRRLTAPPPSERSTTR